MGIAYHTGNSALGMKNLLINSNGLVNQRGYVSGTATTVSNQYTVDRWRVVTLGQNLTFTTTNGVTTFTAPAGGVEQVIENLNVLGGSYVLTIGGTATAVVAESADNVTYTTITPVDGKYAITGGKYVKVTFSGGTFSLPQFERGTIATPYEFREFGGEVQACQRYAPVFGGNTTQWLDIMADGLTTTTSALYASFPVRTRVAPTGITVVSVGNIRLQNSVDGTSGACSAITFNSATNELARLNATTVAGAPSNGAHFNLKMYSDIATAKIIFTGCEL